RDLSRSCRACLRPPGPTALPYTTLFRARDGVAVRAHDGEWVGEKRGDVFLRAIEENHLDAVAVALAQLQGQFVGVDAGVLRQFGDRKSTRLNSSHVKSSYAVFCLQNKKN